MTDQENIGKISLTFLDVLNQLKIYHWQTTSYARHKASCQLITNLTDMTDKILETLQGSNSIRLYIPDDFNTITLTNQSDKSIIGLLEYFKVWLVETFPQYLDPNDTDIINLRDEILGQVNQTLYLFSFN
jgi:hypothetical protein